MFTNLMDFPCVLFSSANCYQLPTECVCVCVLSLEGLSLSTVGAADISYDWPSERIDGIGKTGVRPWGRQPSSPPWLHTQSICCCYSILSDSNWLHCIPPKVFVPSSILYQSVGPVCVRVCARLYMWPWPWLSSAQPLRRMMAVLNDETL